MLDEVNEIMLGGQSALLEIVSKLIMAQNYSCICVFVGGWFLLFARTTVNKVKNKIIINGQVFT